ncbi:MAG: YkgJ family cysteine cluster protein [Bacteroidales bacterium]|jgi:hypothetical protein|nr:YkgJ family cysteine cluster protein [Bacteroidales bacterium]
MTKKKESVSPNDAAAKISAVYTSDLLSNLPALAPKAEPGTRELFKQLKRKKNPKLDVVVAEIHEGVFEKINCLSCANCCKTLGPRITDADIQRLSKALRIKPGAVIDTYLRVDEDNDYVFKNMPCPFLMEDNYCMVYESRPKACKEYPHTNRKRFDQAFQVTIKNTYTCPAAFLVVEELKTVFGS